MTTDKRLERVELASMCVPCGVDATSDNHFMEEYRDVVQEALHAYETLLRNGPALVALDEAGEIAKKCKWSNPQNNLLEKAVTARKAIAQFVKHLRDGGDE